MGIIELYRNNREDIESKKISQIIAFCGDGNLKDNSRTSLELKEFLSEVPTELIKKYVLECSSETFKDNGFILQDILNEIGTRLGFDVKAGLYRGSSNKNGLDGLWENDENSLVIEVKTTDAYRINLDTLVKYRERGKQDDIFKNENVYFLLIVLREDTGDLEAQIRGSRISWDTRLISVDSLIKLLDIKEGSDNPDIIKRIQDILIPIEYTRLDNIINLAFSAMEDDKSLEDEIPRLELENDNSTRVREIDHESNKYILSEGIKKAERYLGYQIKKENRSIYKHEDSGQLIVCKVSKKYVKNEDITMYWFGFYFSQYNLLDSREDSFILLGCGAASNIFLLPFQNFKEKILKLNSTISDSSFYHISIKQINEKYYFLIPNEEEIDISNYILSL